MTTNNSQITSIGHSEDLLTRYGRQLYEINPSLSSDLLVKRSIRQLDELSGDRREQLEDTREILPNLFSTEELDADRFVKFYLAGIRQYARLNRPGANLLEFVCDRLSQQNSQDKDTIYLNYILASKWQPDLNRRTYSRGIAELLAKEFVFRSTITDLYFINVMFIFNGDRSILAQSDRDLR